MEMITESEKDYHNFNGTFVFLIIKMEGGEKTSKTWTQERRDGPNSDSNRVRDGSQSLERRRQAKTLCSTGKTKEDAPKKKRYGD